MWGILALPGGHVSPLELDDRQTTMPPDPASGMISSASFPNKLLGGLASGRQSRHSLPMEADLVGSRPLLVGREGDDVGPSRLASG